MTRTAARLFVDGTLGNDELALEERTAHYIGHVLRLAAGAEVVVFNGTGTERRATIERLTRRECRLRLRETIIPLPESPASITLIQGLIKPDRMDMIVQKATELGVTRVVVAKTEFSAVKLDAERAARKLVHWQRIAESACEQSGRHRPTSIEYCRSLADAIAGRPETEQRIALHAAADGATALPDASAGGVALIVGPEGGFSPTEIELLVGSGCRLARLGRRTLRAETAAIVVCAIAQMRWGDLN